MTRPAIEAFQRAEAKRTAAMMLASLGTVRARDLGLGLGLGLRLGLRLGLGLGLGLG